MADGKIKAVTSFTVTCITDLEEIEGGFRAEGRNPIVQGHTYVFSDAGLPESVANKLHKMLQLAIVKKLNVSLSAEPDMNLEEIESVAIKVPLN